MPAVRAGAGAISPLTALRIQQTPLRILRGARAAYERRGAIARGARNHEDLSAGVSSPAELGLSSDGGARSQAMPPRSGGGVR